MIFEDNYVIDNLVWHKVVNIKVIANIRALILCVRMCLKECYILCKCLNLDCENACSNISLSSHC